MTEAKHAHSMFWQEAKALDEHSIREGKTIGLPPIAVAKAVYQAFILEKPEFKVSRC